MRPKLSLLFIFLIGLIGCLPEQEPVAVTRPVMVTEMPTEVGTAVPPTNTLKPTATEVAAATAAPTITPQPTSTPEPAWPTTPILFVRDGALHRWLPQTNEVELLVEGIDNHPDYAPDIAVFMREVVPQEEYALIVFHIPTRTEVEVLRHRAYEIPNRQTGISTYVSPLIPVTVSANGRWLAYVLQNEETGIDTLFVHEIQTSTQGVALSPVLFSRESPMPFEWPYVFLTWPTANEISWMEPDGFWVANLATTPIAGNLEILASTNVVLVPPRDPEKEPFYMETTYIPYKWSPNGRYLLALESDPRYEDSASSLILLEREANQSFELPESQIYTLSDGAIWVDNSHILLVSANGQVQTWQLFPEAEDFLALTSTFKVFPAVPNQFGATNIIQMANNHFRVSSYIVDVMYDLDLATHTLTILSVNHNEESYQEHIWSPNGEYVLWWGLTFQNNKSTMNMSLDFLNGEPPVDMSHIFGADSCCWYWERAGSE